MPSKLETFSNWQDSINDNRLYPYLVRLAILANKQDEAAKLRKEEENIQKGQELSKESVVVSKLPRGTLKALMTYFKQLALDKQAEPVEPALKRTYLAFYAQLLQLKSSQPEDLEDLGQAAELLIVKFLAIVSKVSGSDSVETQGSLFVSLIRTLARKNGGSLTLDSQLEARERKFFEKAAPRSTKKTAVVKDVDIIAEQVARVMLVSPTLFQRDMSREHNIDLEGGVATVVKLKKDLNLNRHPLYQSTDFPSNTAWNQFVEIESTELDKLIDQFPSFTGLKQAPLDLVPTNVRGHFTLLVKRCIQADAKAATLLSHKSKTLLNYVCQFWRISSWSYVSCALAAVRSLLLEDKTAIETVLAACEYLGQIVSECRLAPLPVDTQLANEVVELLRGDLFSQLRESLTLLFSPDMPKLGPLVMLLEDALPSISLKWGKELIVQRAETKMIERVLSDVAENEYVKLVSCLPRDSALDVQHILDFVQAIIRNAQKLQKKYRSPLLGRIPIAKVVCARNIKLFASDFPPIWAHCLRQYKVRNEEPPFDLMQTLHNELMILCDLRNQVDPENSTVFDPEPLLFPVFQTWALSASATAREWVKPILEQDSYSPLDLDNDIMYSSSVKDLFSSFNASVSMIEKQNWKEHYYMAKLLTIIIEGISGALCEWAAGVLALFVQELKPVVNKPKFKMRGPDDPWLSYAKEATVQATAVVMTSRMNQHPLALDFKSDSCVKLNNIAAAYDLFHKMESQLSADEIFKEVKQKERELRSRSRDRSATYLFTVNILSLSDVKDPGSGFYVTLVDQDSRKQLGKTSTSFGGQKKQKWNEPIELEVSANRPKLLKATLWSHNSNSDHNLCGRAMIRLDPSQFSRRDYGTLIKWIDFDSGNGKLQVMLTTDLLQDDIRFHFGKALRFLRRTQDSMISSIVEQFNEIISAVLSRATLREITGSNRIATSVQTGVTQLQKSFNSWLGKSLDSPPVDLATAEKSVDDCLTPLYDHLNKNFGTLAEILTSELRIEVLSGTWDIVLEALESLIIPPLDYRRTPQTQLNSAEMEVVFSWLRALRDFFYSDGAGPSLERLQSQSYQQIMAIPVYYDLDVPSLKAECEKVVKTSLRAIAGNQELMARQRTVMAHRNKSIIDHQASQLHNAQRTTPQLDDVILRILRLRGEYTFIEQHLKFRERLLQRELTEKALQGSFF